MSALYRCLWRKPDRSVYAHLHASFDTLAEALGRLTQLVGERVWLADPPEWWPMSLLPLNLERRGLIPPREFAVARNDEGEVVGAILKQ